MAIFRRGNVYHCWTFTVSPGDFYDVKANHYPKSQAIFENVNIYVSSPCNVIFHDSTGYDSIPIFEGENMLAVSNFLFRKIYIDNDSSVPVTVRILIFSKNEIAS